MSEGIKNNKKASLDVSYKQFEKLLTVSLLIAIIVVGGFIIFYFLTPEEGFVLFGYKQKNPNTGEWEAENYQTNATIGEQINFSVEVINYMKRDFTFRVKILKGDNDTIIQMGSGTTIGVNLTITTDNITLSHGQKWNSGLLNVTFSQIGENHIILMELWQILDEGEMFWDNLWMRLNITA